MKKTFFMVLALLVSASTAGAVELLSENFDSVSLGSPVDESVTGYDDNAWTATAPDGWTSDPRDTPTGGITEWYGWTFANPEFWVAADDQQRSDFTLGQGVVAVADPDEYDDGGADVDPDLFSTVLSSPSIDLTNISDITVNFDSSWRPEDAQQAQLNAVFDTGTVNLLNWVSDNTDGDFKADATNESVSVSTSVPAGATSVTLQFDMPQGGNDWWWAIDNVVVEGTMIPEPTSGLLALMSCFALFGLRRK